jgi:hypothetical protein
MHQGVTTRFVPLEVFAVMEGFLVVSLIHAPAPWLTGLGGYTPALFLVSWGLGVGLSLVAFMNSIGGWIRFRTHLRVLLAAGIFCLVSSAFLLEALPRTRVIFAIYGLLMTCGALFVVRPEDRLSAAAPSTDIAPAPGKALARADDRQAA